MDFQTFLITIAPNLAGCSASTILAILAYNFIKKLFAKKANEIGENADIKELRKEVKEVKDILNKIRGKSQ